MEKKIVIKEVDKLASALHKNRIVIEYLIYLMDASTGFHTPLEAYTEFGEENKKARVNELILLHFTTDDTVNINKDEIIEEVSFNDYSKELKKLWKK